MSSVESPRHTRVRVHGRSVPRQNPRRRRTPPSVSYRCVFGRRALSSRTGSVQSASEQGTTYRAARVTGKARRARTLQVPRSTQTTGPHTSTLFADPSRKEALPHRTSFAPPPAASSPPHGSTNKEKDLNQSLPPLALVGMPSSRTEPAHTASAGTTTYPHTTRNNALCAYRRDGAPARTALASTRRRRGPTIRDARAPG